MVFGIIACAIPFVLGFNPIDFMWGCMAKDFHMIWSQKKGVHRVQFMIERKNKLNLVVFRMIACAIPFVLGFSPIDSMWGCMAKVFHMIWSQKKGVDRVQFLIER